MPRRKSVVVAARREGVQCAACGATGEPLQVDHILALARGGEDELSNTQLLCSPCHKRKTREDVRAIAKTKRIRKKHFGEGKPRRRKKISGEVVYE